MCDIPCPNSHLNDSVLAPPVPTAPAVPLVPTKKSPSDIDKYDGVFGSEQYPFEADIKDYLISYLENWSRKWDLSGTKESSFMDTDIDSIMNESSILEPENPLEQNNNVKDRHCDGNIHAAVVPADDNTLKQNNLNKNTNNYFGEQNYYSDGNIITPSAHTTVVIAVNNINHGLGCSLMMDEIFPYNEQFVSFPEVHDQEAVSALTPNSTADGAAGTFAWLIGKFDFLNPKPESGSGKFTAV